MSLNEMLIMISKTILLIAFAFGCGLVLQIGRKYLILENLKPYIPMVSKIILTVEKECRTQTGAEKMAIVEEKIIEVLPTEAIKKIKKSPYKTIGNFVQFVFGIVEPIILTKMGIRKNEWNASQSKNERKSSYPNEARK